MFDFNDSFGLHVTSLLKKITNEPTCTQGFLFIFQFSSSRNSPGGDMQIKSSSAAYFVSEWFSTAQSGHHKHRLARAPFLCQKQGGWKLCPQPARGAHARPQLWHFPLVLQAPHFLQSQLLTFLWPSGTNLGTPTSPTAQRWINFNCQKCGRTFRSAWNQLPKLWNSYYGTASEHTVKRRWPDRHPPGHRPCHQPKCHVHPEPAMHRAGLTLVLCSTWRRWWHPRNPLLPAPFPLIPTPPAPSSCFPFNHLSQASL